MASLPDLIDIFALKVESHARMPAGSAAAEVAAVAMLKAKHDLLMRYAEGMAEIALLRDSIVDIRNQINTDLS